MKADGQTGHPEIQTTAKLDPNDLVVNQNDWNRKYLMSFLKITTEIPRIPDQIVLAISHVPMLIMNSMKIVIPLHIIL